MPRILSKNSKKKTEFKSFAEMLEAPSSDDELNLFEAKIVEKKSPNFSETGETSKKRKIPENSEKKRKKKMPEKSAKKLKKLRSDDVKKLKSEDVVTDLVLSDDDS